MMWRNARWVILLIGMLMSALVALLPGTRWIVLTQLRMAWDPGTYEALSSKKGRLHLLPEVGEFSTGVRTRIEQFVREHPDDFPIQLGWKLMYRPDRWRLRQLLPRFGDRPVLLANILRYDCMEVDFERKEVYLLNCEPPPSAPLPTVPPTVLAEMEKVIRRGEQIDPDNAFFTMMRSAVLFAGFRDQEAIEALLEASRKHRWDDYVFEGARFSYSLLNQAIDKHSVAFRITLQMSMVFAHYSAIRFCADMATYTAIQMEKQGRSQNGIDVRLALQQCAKLMRLHGRSLVTVHNAHHIFERAMLLPQYNVQHPDKEVKERLQLHLFTRFLREAGREADAEWAEMEFERFDEMALFWKQARETTSHPFFHFPIALARAWIMSAFLLTCVLAVGVLWSVYTIIASTRLRQGNFVTWVWVVALTGIGISLWLSGWWRSVGMFLVIARIVIQWSPDYEENWLDSALRDLSFVLDSDAMPVLLAYRVAHTLGVTLLLSFITGAFALVAVITKRGCAESVALGWRRHGALLTGGLMILYALSVLYTAQVECYQERELRAMDQNEARYVLQQIGWREEP